ncbi:MAG: hypothetical protein KKG21_02940 [Candidatus Omnitrophica bacterium]|nr:hypothetical protein [Candidatus Omnitrophota bacterium]
MNKESEIRNFYLKTKGTQGNVLGKSMEPVIKEGWSVKIQPIDENEIKIGDIVSFGQDIFTCHRIIGKVNFFGQYYFIHKGDNSSVGGIFEAKDLIGQVVKIIDDKGQKTNEEKQRYLNFKHKKMINYLYLFMYLTKRYIFRIKTNSLTSSINRLFWRFLVKRTLSEKPFPPLL